MYPVSFLGLENRPMSPISEAIVYARIGPILRDRQEERDGGVVGAEPSEVRLASVDLRAQFVDHPQACC